MRHTAGGRIRIFLPLPVEGKNVASSCPEKGELLMNEGRVPFRRRGEIPRGLSPALHELDLDLGGLASGLPTVPWTK